MRRRILLEIEHKRIGLIARVERAAADAKWDEMREHMEDLRRVERIGRMLRALHARDRQEGAMDTAKRHPLKEGLEEEEIFSSRERMTR